MLVLTVLSPIIGGSMRVNLNSFVCSIDALQRYVLRSGLR